MWDWNPLVKSLHTFRSTGSEIAIDFGAVLDAVDADEGLWMIDPVEDAPVAHAQFAKTGEVVRHSDQSAMHHGGCVFRQPKDFAFDTRADGGVEFAELHLGAEPTSTR